MPKILDIKTKHSGVIELNSFHGEEGSGLLSCIESLSGDSMTLPIAGGDEVFRVRRFFVITDITKSDTVRANHAHRKTSEAIFCVHGSCTVSLDDGEVQQDIVLDDPSIGVITGPNLWHRITDFAPGTVLLALADGPYDPDEYVHMKKDFMETLKDHDISGDVSRVQRDIDRVWHDAWEELVRIGVPAVLQTRLTNEGFDRLSKQVPPDARTILEIGTGTGRFGALIAKMMPRAEVTMTDIVPQSLVVAKKLAESMDVHNVSFETADTKALPFEDGAFDVVLSDGVVQHLPNEESAWKEMARVVRPGGTVIVSSVNRWNFHTFFRWLRGHRYEYGFERSYTHGDFVACMREAGLSVVGHDGFFPAYGVARLTRKHKWVKPIARAFDILCRLGDKLTKRWVSRTFGFEIVIVAKKDKI